MESIGLNDLNAARNGRIHSTRHSRYLRLHARANICPSLYPYLKISNNINNHLAIILKATIKNKYGSMLIFEKVCKDKFNFEFNRRTLNGLIANDRGDFRLSWFTICFGVMGINIDDILREYLVA